MKETLPEVPPRPSALSSRQRGSIGSRWKATTAQVGSRTFPIVLLVEERPPPQTNAAVPTTYKEGHLLLFQPFMSSTIPQNFSHPQPKPTLLHS